MTVFNFLAGISSDSKGNVYFCDTRLKEIYKWPAENNSGKLVADYTF